MKSLNRNEIIVKKYLVYLQKLDYSEHTGKMCAVNKLRVFTRDKDFGKLDIIDLKQLFGYLKIREKFSDAYLSSLGTELRRFFRFLREVGINDNLMYSLVIPARKKHAPHIPLNILKKRYRKFHPRAVEA